LWKKGCGALAIFKNRFPSRQETILAFAACVFPIHAWAIYRTLSELPAWLQRLTLWDLIGAVAYTQVFALFESVGLLSILVFSSALLPARLFRHRFVAQSSTAVFLTSAWAVAIHFELIWPWEADIWSLLWLSAYLSLLAAGALLVHARPKFANGLVNLVERLMPLSFAYVALSMLSILVVILRNAVRVLG